MYITLMKIMNKGLKEMYMIQDVWYLEDLTLVDGKDATSVRLIVLIFSYPVTKGCYCYCPCGKELREIQK